MRTLPTPHPLRPILYVSTRRVAVRSLSASLFVRLPGVCCASLSPAPLLCSAHPATAADRPCRANSSRRMALRRCGSASHCR